MSHCDCCDCEERSSKISNPPYILFGVTKCGRVDVTLGTETHTVTPNKEGQFIIDLNEFECGYKGRRKIKVNGKTFKIDKTKSSMEIKLQNAKTD